MRLGAVDLLEKPVFAEALAASVDRALGRVASQHRTTFSGEATKTTAAAAGDDPEETSRPAPTAGTTTPDGLTLWATAMPRVINGPDDVPNVGRWAVRLKTSESTIHRWCRTCRVCARASLHLARVLRAIRCAHEQGGTPDRFLAVREAETRDRLLIAGGVRPGPLPALDEALARQTLVENPLAIATLRRELAEVDRESGAS